MRGRGGLRETRNPVVGRGMKGSTLNALKTEVFPPDLLPLLPSLAGTVQDPRALTPEQYRTRRGRFVQSRHFTAEETVAVAGKPRIRSQIRSQT